MEPTLSEAPAVRSSDQELSNAVRAVFDIMVGLEVETPANELAVQAGVLTAIVHITGQQKGAVAIHCPASQACMFAGRFLSKDAPPLVNDEVLDVLGELANMVAGNVKAKLMPDAHLSVPAVVEGSEGMVALLWKTAQRKMFNTEVGAFWVSITVASPPEQQTLSPIQARAAELAKQLA